ncbi:MAG TPA: GntR family transcriptional regulator [Desulfuromonadales bacterium]|nr:GntR family transcriptional regulator [Desulfuromonadales bacterium]
MKEVVKFTPVKVGRASEDICLQIEAAIVGGQLEPGESLPSERELQVQFETGRGVVREALRALKQKGLIEIKKGAKGGAFVKHIEVANVSESLALFLKLNRISPEHLIEFRESIDQTITTLAIARGEESQKQNLIEGTEKLQAFIQQSDPDLEVLAEMDRELNVSLAKMTKNPVFEWIMQAIQLGFSSHDYALYEDRYYREKTMENWVQTAHRIAENEPLKALSSIGYHYVLLRRCIAERRVEESENPLQDEGEMPSAG